jgi:endonuclease/exonuclease/phosphatase family metal-dependent hydrolase
LLYIFIMSTVQVNVLSYNILYKGMHDPRLTNISNFIKSNGPFDFIGFQEASNWQQIKVNANLNNMDEIVIPYGCNIDDKSDCYTYNKSLSTWYSKKDGSQLAAGKHVWDEESVLLYNKNKYTLTDKYKMGFSYGRPAIIGFFNINGTTQKICVINMHPGHGSDVTNFENYIKSGKKISGTYFTGKNIEQQIKSTDHIIVMGDMNDSNPRFNNTPSNKPKLFGIELHNQNTTNTCCYNEADVANNSSNPSGAISVPYDHILSNIAPSNKYVGNPVNPASDHLPIVAKFNFTSSPSPPPSNGILRVYMTPDYESYGGDKYQDCNTVWGGLHMTLVGQDTVHTYDNLNKIIYSLSKAGSGDWSPTSVSDTHTQYAKLSSKTLNDISRNLNHYGIQNVKGPLYGKKEDWHVTLYDNAKQSCNSARLQTFINTYLNTTSPKKWVYRIVLENPTGTHNWIKSYPVTRIPAFSSATPVTLINPPSTTPKNIFNTPIKTHTTNWDKPDHNVYKHCKPHPILSDLQTYYNKNSVKHTIFYDHADINSNDIVHIDANSQLYKIFFQDQIINKGTGINIQNPVYNYIIEQSDGMSLEKIHLVLCRNEFEITSKHITLAKKLNIIDKVMHAGTLQKSDTQPNTITYSSNSGSFYYSGNGADIKKYFDELKKINTNVNFIYVYHHTLPDLKKEDIIEFCDNKNKVYYDTNCGTNFVDNWIMLKNEDAVKEQQKLANNNICKIADKIRHKPAVLTSDQKDKQQALSIFENKLIDKLKATNINKSKLIDVLNYLSSTNH